MLAYRTLYGYWSFLMKTLTIFCLLFIGWMRVCPERICLKQFVSFAWRNSVLFAQRNEKCFVCPNHAELFARRNLIPSVKRHNYFGQKIQSLRAKNIIPSGKWYKIALGKCTMGKWDITVFCRLFVRLGPLWYPIHMIMSTGITEKQYFGSDSFWAVPSDRFFLSRILGSVSLNNGSGNNGTFFLSKI